MKRWGVLVLAGIVMAGADAGASGFAIREQSGSFQGLSFAGVAAGGADLSTMYFNPATLGLHDGIQGHVGISYIMPKAEFQLEEAETAVGTPISGPEGGDIAEDAVVPAAYGMFGYRDWRFGLGVTAPFGLKTEQPIDWVGRYYATESELKTININPAVAYNISPRFTVGAGFVAQYADSTLAQALDFGSAAFAPGLPPGFATAVGATPGENDGFLKVDGTDWDFGFTLGVMAEPIDGTRLGVGYRSQINHSLEGSADFDLGGQVGEALNLLSGGALEDTGGRAALSTPQILSLGVRQRVTDEVDVLGTAEWTGWSTFDELVINFDNPDLAPEVTNEDWRDTWFFSLGVEYRPLEELTLQTGVAYDQSPIPDATRTPRIPGADRTWLSFGAAWQPATWLSVGAGYSRIWVQDGPVNLDDPDAGRLRGTFDNGIDIVTLHGTLRF